MTVKGRIHRGDTPAVTDETIPHLLLFFIPSLAPLFHPAFHWPAIKTPPLPGRVSQGCAGFCPRVSQVTACYHRLTPSGASNNTPVLVSARGKTLQILHLYTIPTFLILNRTFILIWFERHVNVVTTSQLGYAAIPTNQHSSSITTN